MQTLLIIIGLVLALIIGAALALFAAARLAGSKRDTGDENSMVMLQHQLNELTKTVSGALKDSSREVSDLARMMDKSLHDSTRHMHDAVARQFGESQKAMRETGEQMARHLSEVTKGVTEAAESSKQVFTIADQLKNLEKVLTHQKQRGALGEASLELILSNILPATAYKLQHQFESGEAVDAAIITKEGIIPVDAKFSLDNYNRVVNEDDKERREQLEKDFKNDLKKRIDETAKYIRPKEGTLPFAFMFIPAEGIYYDLLVNEVGAVKVNTRNLIDYAYKDKHVIIVSPTTFAAYLQSVLYGFRAFKIEESAKQIGKQVEQLSRHLKSYDDYFKKVGNALSTTVNHYNAASKELGKIDKDVFKITGTSADTEHLMIEKPIKDEE